MPKTSKIELLMRKAEFADKVLRAARKAGLMGEAPKGAPRTVQRFGSASVPVTETVDKSVLQQCSICGRMMPANVLSIHGENCQAAKGQANNE